MQYHKQLFRHDPAHEIWGDCYRTAIACLLDMEPEAVPHFAELLAKMRGDVTDEDVTADVRTWLAERGLALFRVAFDGGMTFEDMLEWTREWNPELRLLVSGEGQRGFAHVVVVKDGKVEWDTAIDIDAEQPNLVAPYPEYGYWLIEAIGAFQ